MDSFDQIAAEANSSLQQLNQHLQALQGLVSKCPDLQRSAYITGILSQNIQPLSPPYTAQTIIPFNQALLAQTAKLQRLFVALHEVGHASAYIYFRYSNLSNIQEICVEPQPLPPNVARAGYFSANSAVKYWFDSYAQILVLLAGGIISRELLGPMEGVHTDTQDVVDVKNLLKGHFQPEINPKIAFDLAENRISNTLCDLEPLVIALLVDLLNVLDTGVNSMSGDQIRGVAAQFFSSSPNVDDILTTDGNKIIASQI
jgi:hypothetical protein